MEDGVWHKFAFTTEDGPRMCGIRFVERDGRFVPTDLFLSAERLTPGDLRRTPLSRWESFVNAHGGALERTLVESPGSAHRDISLAEMRLLLSHVASHPTFREGRDRLTRPDGTDPERFYRLVAEAYREYAEETRAVAHRIAEEADVPVTTAHRWIREARARGFLPPGRKGRVG
jgi:hypothetical protein